MAAAVLLAALVAPAATAIAAASPRDAGALAKSTYIYIATVRKDGNQSQAAPVWFITTGDNQVLIETSPASWKARRIKRGSPALVWIGSRTGPAFIGKAEIVEDKALQDQVIAGYPKKYMLARIGYARPTRAKLDSGQIVVIRISPTRDLPDGFQSAPATPAPVLDETAKPASAQ
ncbi:pyridoxamine 5'-phosphate oxidase family protein [Candidatus Binatus sp.]|uniref:pyridoxamine 5'-phosphate oxidase family protein n=1 Tax=Candidatus Binatus sp. TaxID=2811406 RepID=UPI002F92EE56